MKTRKALISSALILVTTTALAQTSSDKMRIAPPSDFRNIRLGLWEETTETTTQGGPKIDMAQIQSHMAEDIKGMTPEQRARIQALMNKQAARASGQPMSHTRQKCFTAAERDKDLSHSLNERDSADVACTTKEVSRTSSKIVAEMHCTGKDKGQVSKAEGRGESPIVMTQDGTISFELKSPTEIETRFQMNAMIGKEPMRSEMKMHGRWISAECGKVR